jgi:hypothetical protein
VVTVAEDLPASEWLDRHLEGVEDLAGFVAWLEDSS